MTRPIKFRVWDKENGEWLEYAKVLVGWQCPVDKPHKAVKMKCYRSLDGAAFNDLQWCLDHPEGFAVMQFTGLLDKNGKEIYEGDIVSFTGMSKAHQTPFAIKWDADRAEFSKYSPRDQAEIVGNIYETPELLP